MCGMLDHYIQAFTELETDGGQNPGEPILLLTVLDLIGSGTITRNFIEISPSLINSYQKNLNVIGGTQDLSDPAAAFLTLKRTGFWHLRPRPEIEINKSQKEIDTPTLRKHYFGATLNDDLFPLLKMQTYRERLRHMLQETYFSTRP